MVGFGFADAVSVNAAVARDTVMITRAKKTASAWGG
jgi:hypothetical protein